MSEQLSEREHLMRDASGLRERMLLESADGQWHVIGRRVNGAVSIFAGESFVIQFNAAGALRRLFVNDTRFAAQGGQLMRAVRTASRGSMSLQSSALASEKQSQMITQVRAEVAAARERVQQVRATILAERTEDQPTTASKKLPDSELAWEIIADEPLPFLSSLLEWFEAIESQELIVADRPNA